MGQPIRIHPVNPKVFEFRGRPRVLVCATEHYGAVFNRPFRFERYLADAAEKAQTLSRLFILFREQQHAVNPYSTCKPESTDFVSPYPRTGPGKAIDGLPKYDLDRWNPEFFDRLHQFLTMASEYGINIEVVILSNTYNDDIWMLNPLNPHNNISGTETIRWPEYMTQRHPKMFERQRVLVQKIVQEVNRYDNVLFEICNEPTAQAPGSEGLPRLDEVNAWQGALADVIRKTEAALPNKHLLAGQEAYRHDGYRQGADLSFGMFFDIVNIHPLPNTSYGGTEYDMGTFMSKELKLRAVRDFCLATGKESKPVNCDEDNVASRFRDVEGWTIHRKRAWVTLLCGCHYDYIDFSILPNLEAGTEESRRHIRTWIGHLSRFIHSLNLVRAKPLSGWLKSQPPHTLECVYGADGEDYAVYLADVRELNESGAGEPVQGPVAFDLPKGRYRMACYSPATGLYSPWVDVEGGRIVNVTTPVFQDDLVVRITKA